jgi:putative ABC transport system permease protein
MRPFGKTYVKTILREIRGTFSRFVAIFAIVALGVGFLAGLLATTPDMKISLDRYFDETNMMDLFVKATMGITEDDVRAAEALEETGLVLPAYAMDTLVRTSGTSSVPTEAGAPRGISRVPTEVGAPRGEELITARIYGLPLEAARDEGFVNRLELTSGRFPQADDECLVQQGGGYFEEFPIGTVFTIISPDLDEEQKVYHVDRYTITGIVKNPLFISFDREPTGVGNGRLGTALYVRDTSFALPVWTDLYITLKDARPRTSFTDPYQRAVDAARSTLEALGTERSLIRREEILTEARTRGREEIDRGSAEYEQARITARRELAAARQRLDEGAEELARGKAELEEGEERIARGRETLALEQARTKKELEDAGALLRRGETEIAAAQRTLAEGKAQLDAVEDEVEKTRASRFRMSSARGKEGVAQYDQGRREWEEGSALVTAKERELRQGRTDLEQGRVRAGEEFAKAQADLDAGETEIAAGWLELLEAREELIAGEEEYHAARIRADRMLREGEEGLLDAQRKVGTIVIDQPQWYVLDRNSNVGCANFRANAEKIADLARVFPVFFLLVAALVALTSMTRMVEEERTQIGALKALGYRKRVIAAKYLIYCGLTGILGSALGMVTGFWGLPLIIYSAFGTMYRLPPLVTEFNWPFGLIACGAVLICTMGATVYACYSSLWEKPAALLRPRPPRAGKRIFLESLPFIWNSMKFTHKVSARNLMRYKKHFFMTVIGIAGCTALMLTGFGLRDSIVSIARNQFEDILKYDLRLELEEAGAGAGEEIIHTYLPRTNAVRPGGYTEINISNGYVISGHERLSASVFIPRESASLGAFIGLKNRRTRDPFNFTADSAIITEKMAAVLGLSPGDRFTLENAEGRRAELILTGFTENYVGNYLYLGSGAYQAAFGGSLSYGTLLVNTGVKDLAGQDAITRRVLESDLVSGAEFTSQIQRTYNNLLVSINFVVLILIAAAGGLAVIVLYNLTYININERSRELATLRVLGFHRNEAAAYIFREISVLSITGAVAGLILGIPLHRFIIGVAENTDLMFGRNIAPLSFVFSALITLGFSGLVDILMLGKILRIKMAESMKGMD